MLWERRHVRSIVYALEAALGRISAPAFCTQASAGVQTQYALLMQCLRPCRSAPMRAKADPTQPQAFARHTVRFSRSSHGNPAWAAYGCLEAKPRQQPEKRISGCGHDPRASTAVRASRGAGPFLLRNFAAPGYGLAAAFYGPDCEAVHPSVPARSHRDGPLSSRSTPATSSALSALR